MHLKTFDQMKKISVFFMLKPVNAIYWFIVTICVLIAVILVWAAFAPMDDVVKSTVILRPNQAVSSIKCVTSGQVYSKNFENDDIVNENDLLFALDTSVFKTELEAYKNQKYKNENDISINNILIQTIDTETLPETDKLSDAFVKSYGYVSELQRYQTVILDMKTKLNREQAKPAGLIVPQNVIDLQNQLSQNELAFETWKNNQKMQALEANKQLVSTKKSIESRISELERTIKNSTIYAPISGRITEITKLNIGDYLFAGEEILRIVPQNNKTLKADIYIDASYVARVKVGNPLKIKFPGLPPSRYGMKETEISIVPPDVTYLNNQVVFIAEAEISDPYLYAKNGQTATLIPGITAEGRIITDRSTVMHMILRKLDFIN
ncbi:MAG TPA: HlyD family efflux transporter periplasmic adaptor subunit [Treponemataceae bacterium]|nr:HlyD family efflux transporter periplasmic adaptor subunit [Treponemataceae bacterium]HQL05206.1 HlyD family efflux transporter periplasmic adaptor subunit [Treponemataceae bacterium]